MVAVVVTPVPPLEVERVPPILFRVKLASLTSIENGCREAPVGVPPKVTFVEPAVTLEAVPEAQLTFTKQNVPDESGKVYVRAAVRSALVMFPLNVAAPVVLGVIARVSGVPAALVEKVNVLFVLLAIVSPFANVRSPFKVKPANVGVEDVAMSCGKERVIVPLPLVTVTWFVVPVIPANVYPEPLPIKSCPLVGVVVTPVPPLAIPRVPDNVRVPDVVTGPPEKDNPVVPPDALTEVTVPQFTDAKHTVPDESGKV